ncbi:wall-associated receptor kinase-like 20 [Momordica charantia]|uniref:Wall-associated receptor kinase-like 20 n=1 Tax=Momordica charantia TaxID=3673 RepID=A0A6J1DS11_MOMCH|nr:wall-associated receptor kinase-like 20 [Momordica charantia]
MKNINKTMLLIFALFFHVSKALVCHSCPKCGNLEVPYPLSTNDNCGDSRYRIYCYDGILQFKSSGGFYYNIHSIDPDAYKLIIRPPQIKRKSCYSSDLSLGGLRLDEHLPFNISTQNTVMLLNCSDNLINSPLNCSTNSLCRQFEEKMEESSGCKNTLCCTYLKDSAMTSHMIRVRIGGCTAYTAVVNLKPGDPFETWNYGIELQWVPPN